MSKTLNASGEITIGSVTYYNGKKCVVGIINKQTVTLYDYVTMVKVGETALSKNWVE